MHDGWLASQAVHIHSLCRKGMHLALTPIYNLVLAPCLAERYKVNGPIVIYCIEVYIGPNSDSSMRNFSQVKREEKACETEKKFSKAKVHSS
jgi:hypothetical protein